MKMRMPRKEQVSHKNYMYFNLDGTVCVTCAVGWLLYQQGIWKNEEDRFETNADPPLEDNYERSTGLVISQEFEDAYIHDVPLEYIHQLMLDLGHEPVYDPLTTDPYWMTPEKLTEEEHYDADANAVQESIRV